MILNSAEEIRQIYATGQGTIKLRGQYEPHPDRPGAILITSIPYGIEKDALVERIGELIAKGQVPQLTNVKDLSTDDVRILLELRSGANPDAALAYLFKNSPLQINYSINLTCLLPADGAEVAVPSRLDLKTILQQFLDFRLEVVTRRLQYELRNLLERIHILEGFAIVFKNLDEAIAIIRASEGKADAAPKLIGAVRAFGAAGRRDSRDEALPAGQARDSRHPERAGRRSASGPKRSSSYSRTSRRGGR